MPFDTNILKKQDIYHFGISKKVYILVISMEVF